ncbi:uncharacterized protein LOC108627317 [Ceratina calcarata]|uniref:Uncharacterized protein LOC108627317 n=1 Tax=Ceratina calcarata TaxID=156304 RepID=A0AAJ7N9A6_9HYME|nr:uncharacterized protein LOC108627317 [Ceratina calcarata]
MPASSFTLLFSTLVINGTIGNRISYDNLIEETVSIVRSCTKFDSDDTLLLAGEYEDFFKQPSFDEVPVALISESKSALFELYTLSKYSFFVFEQFTFLHYLWRLNQFILIASSQPMLRLLLQNVNDSTWANSNGLHVLIDGQTEKRGCVNAFRFLWTAWEYDRINTIFPCIDPVEGLVLYTYNPYSNAAPAGWQEAGRFKGRGGHPWVLLKRKYNNSDRCEDLLFDRTKDVNGYVIRMNAISFIPYLRINPSKTGADKFTGDNSEIAKIVVERLNASLQVLEHNGTIYDLGGIDSDGNVMGMMAEVATGVVDMGMNVRSLHAMWKVEHTYPHELDGLCVITRRAGQISELYKIVSFISPGALVVIIILMLIALSVLTLYTGFLSSCMNIIRLITSVSMIGLPVTNFGRILISNLFFLVFILNALFQSHWSSLLTIPVSLPNIRTAEDLKKSNCEIYGSVYNIHVLQDPEFRSRFHAETYDGCKQRVLKSRYAACLDNCIHLYTRIQNEPLRRSGWIQQNVQVYVTRENWPLLHRAMEVIRKSVEAGLVTMWKKLNTRWMHAAWQRKKIARDKSFRILEIRHVLFSFYLLAVGHFFAATAFIAEIIFARQQRLGHRATRQR